MSTEAQPKIKALLPYFGGKRTIAPHIGVLGRMLSIFHERDGMEYAIFFDRQEESVHEALFQLARWAQDHDEPLTWWDAAQLKDEIRRMVK